MVDPRPLDVFALRLIDDYLGVVCVCVCVCPTQHGTCYDLEPCLGGWIVPALSGSKVQFVSDGTDAHEGSDPASRWLSVPKHDILGHGEFCNPAAVAWVPDLGLFVADCSLRHFKVRPLAMRA